MVSLAEVQTVLGNEPLAEFWLLQAARWGNTEAIEHLRQRSLPIPEPDLFSQQQRQERNQTVAWPIADKSGGYSGHNGIYSVNDYSYGDN
jgi:hypothetical protein